jgi:hypothetical protein
MSEVAMSGRLSASVVVMTVVSAIPPSHLVQQVR